MKKLLYLLPVAALAMASCSNDDNAGIEQSAQQLATADQLMLRPAVGGASTRIAGINTVQDLDEFHIDIAGAFKIGADGETVLNSITANLKNSDNFALKSDNELYYWDDNSTKATFSAYAPTGIDFAQPVVVSNQKAEQKDYLVAYNEGYKSDFRSGVPLNFQHVTSQINVQATNKDFAKVNVAVKAIRFVNIRNTAALSLPTVSTVNGVFSWADYKPWSINNSNTEEYKAETSTTPITLDANAKSLNFGDPQFLLPQQLTAATAPELDGENDWNESLTGHAIAFLIKVTNVNATVSGTTPEAEVDAIAAATTENPYTAYYVYPTAASLKAATNSDGYAWAYVPVDTKWEPGKKYIYTLNFAADAYGKVDPNQGEGGTQNPNDGEDDNDQPGDDIKDVEVPLTFTVTVEDWIDVNEAKNL